MSATELYLYLYAVASRWQEVSGTNARGVRGLHSSLKRGVTPKICMLCLSVTCKFLEYSPLQSYKTTLKQV